MINKLKKIKELIGVGVLNRTLEEYTQAVFNPATVHELLDAILRHVDDIDTEQFDISIIWDFARLIDAMIEAYPTFKENADKVKDLYL